MAYSSPPSGVVWLGDSGDASLLATGASYANYLPPPARPLVEGDAESVSGEVESVLGTAQEGINPFLWVFPVFEWDDGAVFEADEGEEDEFSLQEQDISRLLPPAHPAGQETELEVNAVLEQALLEGSVSGQPLSPSSSAPRAASSFTPSPFRVGASPRHPQVGIMPMSPTRTSSRGQVWRSLTHLPGHSPRTQVSTVIAAPASSAQQALTTPGATSIGDPRAEHILRHLRSDSPSLDMDEGGASLGDTARTSSVYALNDSGGSHTVFSDSLQLDFDQLIALGRAPTRQRLSDDEAAALPRVRFEAPEMQSCSICLEVFRHGMLLTGLQCGHVFHVDCLAQWVQRSSSCPNCRQSIEPCARPQQR